MTSTVPLAKRVDGIQRGKKVRCSRDKGIGRATRCKRRQVQFRKQLLHLGINELRHAEPDVALPRANRSIRAGPAIDILKEMSMDSLVVGRSKPT